MIITPRLHQPHSFDLAINPRPNEQPGSLEWGQDFAAVLGDHHAYWRERVIAAGEAVDLAGHRVAHDVVGIFDSSVRGIKRVALQNSLTGLSPDDRQEALSSMGIAKETDLLAVRREALGALAVSRFITCVLVPERLFPGRHSEGVTLTDPAGAVAPPDFMLDMDADENGMPRDYRIHVPMEVASDPLIFPTGPALDAWYFGRRDGSDVEVPKQNLGEPQDDLLYVRDPSHGNLWMHRTRADFSDGLVLHLQEYDIAPPTNVVTIFPFIPDRSRIPTLGGIR